MEPGWLSWGCSDRFASGDAEWRSMDGAKHRVAKNGVGYGAALSTNFARNLSFQASYDGVDRGKGYHNDRFSAGVSFAF
jgi:opacity protein-like surface antigen